MIPTPVAMRLGTKVAHILTELEDLFEQPEFDPASLNCVYTICATDYAQSVILPSLFALMRQQAPKLKIIVRTFEIDNLDSLMSSGEVDLAFTFPEFIPDHYPYQHLFQEYHVCVASKGFAFAEKQLTIAQVAALPQLVVSPSRANLRGSHDSWFQQRAGKRNIVMSVPFFSAAADCVKSTDIIAFLPSRLLPNDDLLQLSLDETPPGFDVIAAWHSRSSHDPLLSWILGLLDTIFQSDQVISTEKTI